jgi:hypothetical protein
VDLLGVISASRKALELFRGVRDQPAPWTADAAEFERHFGVAYEDYAEVVELLSTEQKDLLRKTLDVNPEAAVLWVLAMDVVQS